MNQRQKPKRKRGTTAAAVLCFVAAIAIVGTYTFNDYRETQQREELARAEEAEKKAKEKEKEEQNKRAEEKSKETSTDADDIIINTQERPEEESEDGTEENTSDDAAGNNTSLQSTAAGGSAAYFDDSSRLLWPVNGAVILSYSMDKTVYFSTLDQYKYNPAVIIAGAEGDQVICGAPGIVKSIDVTAETGTTVNIDIGNGYELIYGQLKEVPVQVGQAVEAKTVLGYVSQPTKYYSVEGANVYFEMRKDGQPINPVEFME